VETNILDLTKLGTKVHEATEEIPAPGTEENPWIGFKRIVNGQPQFYTLSGKERRRSRRADERAKAAEQRKGQARYNRQQRKAEFLAGTRRQQLRILRGEIAVSPDMQRNLERAILAEQRKHTRAVLHTEA